MEFQPDYSKLASVKLPPEELQAAFNAMLMNAAAIDCGTVTNPDIRRAEFGESLAVNLAMVRRFSPSEENLYRVLLADYIRFCRMYMAASDSPDEALRGVFEKHELKALMKALREAYRKGKKEIPNIY